MRGLASLRLQVNWPRVKDRAREYALLMRLHRPIGAFLLLWPTLWALWIAGAGTPDGHLIVIFALGVLVMRSAGCVINDYADREFDPHVWRTQERPLAAGRVSEREALGVFVALLAIAFVLVLFTNTLTILLAFAGAALAATYPFMKRYHYLPQVHLGAAFGWAIPMAFAAQTGAVPRVAWLLFFVNILWSTIYDTMYAMADRHDDLKIGVKSTAILFGEMDRVIIGVLQVLFLFGLVLVGRQLELGVFYYLGLAAAAGLAAYHQYLIKDRDPERCFRAFLHNNWVGAAIFVGLLLHYPFAG